MGESVNPSQPPLALRFQYLELAVATRALNLLEEVKRLLHGLENSLEANMS